MVPKDHRLAHRILELIPINGLEPELQSQVLARGDIVEIKRRRAVFDAGTRDPYTFYLLQGELELESPHSAPMLMRAGDENARRALAQLQPRRYTARARSPVNVFRIERAVLDYILSDEQVLERRSEVQVAELEEAEEEVDWMSRLLSSALFSRLPPDNIQRFFAELEPVEVDKGQVIIEQGTEGDFLYIIAQGQCVVTRRAPSTGQEIQLAVLREGDSFGEEALISNSPRNASVKMQSDGFLMRLSKRAFEELVSRPTLKPVPWSEAKELVTGGAKWLDVRFVDEHDAGAIVDSRNIPLNVLRLEIPKLNRSARYILYCDTGARSSTGAFLLAREGFDAYYLAGGMEHITEGEDVPLTGPSASSSDDDAVTELLVKEQVQPESAAARKECERTPPPVVSPEIDEASASAPAQAADAEEPAPHEPAADDRAADASDGEDVQEAAAVEDASPRSHTSDSEVPHAVQQHVAALRAERDRVSEFAQQAADTARELKRRYDELHRAAKAERAQRKSADAKRKSAEKELASVRAELKRQTQIERARAEDALRNAESKAEEAGRKHAKALQSMSAERNALRDELAALGARMESAEHAHKDETSAQIAQQVELENSLSGLRSELDAANRRTETLESELAQAREMVEKLELDITEQTISREALKAALASDVTATRQAQDELQEQLERERETLDQELKAFDAARTSLEQDVAAHERTISEQSRNLDERAREIDAREIALEDHRSATDLELARKAEALAADDARLSEEKAAWRERIETAIEAERERLESAYDDYRREVEEQAQASLDDLLEQRSSEMNAEYETRIAELEGRLASESQDAGELDERLRHERENFETRMAALNRVYNVRFAEQAALLEDEQRRLAAGQVRLREALNETERLKQELRTTPVAKKVTPPTLVERAVDNGELAVAEPPPPAAAPRERPPPEQPPSPPVLDGDMVASNYSRDGDERARVLTPAQITQIRRKMQEKMAATRRSG